MTAERVVITGAGGQVGRQLVAVFARAGWDVVAFDSRSLDVTTREARRIIAAQRAAVVVNAAAWTDVDGCARDPERAMEVNGAGAGRIAQGAAETAALMVQISTNEVFDGTAGHPYREDDVPNPINPYAASKLAGERAVREACPRHIVIRTAWVFGPGGHNFPAKIIEAAHRSLASGTPLRVVGDELGNPTWAPALAAGVKAAVEAAREGRLEPGFLHLCGEPGASRLDWAREVLAELPAVRLERISSAEYPRASLVPLRAVLSTEKARRLSIGPLRWRSATHDYARSLVVTATA